MSKIPIAALIALIMVLSTETFLHVNRIRLADGIEAILMQKVQAIGSDDNPSDDVVIFGDSKMFSLRPDIVNEAFKSITVEDGSEVRVSNYSWPFFGVEAYELMLRQYLQHNIPPRIVIINGRPELVATPSRRNSLLMEPAHRRRAFIALPLREIVAFGFRHKHPGLLWKRLTWMCTPTSSIYPDASFEAIKDIIRGKGWTKPGSDYTRMTESYAATGAFLMHRNRQVSVKEIDDLEQIEGPFGIYPNVDQVESFERFLTMAREKETKVVMLGSPAPEEYLEKLQRVGSLDAYTWLTRHWKKRFTNFHVAGPLYPVQPLIHFGDAGHLNQIGDGYFQETYPTHLTSHIRETSLSTFLPRGTGL